jgi:hypothetical protein
MCPRSIRFSILLLSAVSIASADAIYKVTVNTSVISGTAGALDFNFNPGPLVSQPASLEILTFTSSGTLAGVPTTNGNVSGGPLPSNLTFDNGTVFNDYFQDFAFGSAISFNVRLFGPALNSPDGTSTSGSTFGFSMFSDAGGTVPVLTTDLGEGFAFRVDVNLDGTATVTNFSSETDVVPVTSIPEPANWALVVTGIVWFVKRRRTTRNSVFY